MARENLSAAGAVGVSLSCHQNDSGAYAMETLPYTDYDSTIVRPSTELFLTRTVAILGLVLGLAAITVSFRVMLESVIVGLILVGFGIACLLMARYCWKQTPESVHPVDDPLWLGGALIAHRRDLEKAAQAGCVLTLACLAAFCFGQERPMRAAFWPLLVGSFVLFQVARNSAGRRPANEQDWIRVPRTIRIVLQPLKTLLSVLFVLFLLAPLFKLLSLNPGGHSEAYRLAAWIVAGGDIAFLLALEGLFFRYGELRSVADTRERRDQ
ncbi:MAG: hypothetical protein ABSF98_05555 [Bryobacteraceae bacterium]|jgi:hypothetical protein